MSDIIKCQHCGTFVPSEKAFCPNCSEPMEPEERPNRAHSFSSDMLATIRDDPEQYKHLLEQAGVKKPTAQQGGRAPAATAAPPAPIVVDSNRPAAPPVNLPRQKNPNGRLLLLGGGALVLIALVVILLIVFKVI